MSRHLDIAPRAEELLVDQVLVGLDIDEQKELDALLADEAEQLQAELMQTAALVQLGMLKLEPETAQKMPEHLRRSVLASTPLARVKDAGRKDNVVTMGDSARQRSTRSAANRRPDFGKYAGWAVAAAVAAVFLVFRADIGPESALTGRAQLAASAPDLITAPWAVSDQPGYENVRGDVIWSDSAQNGYMRLAGLPANDPAEGQYQLWIVDPERSAEPVDGGVFDIPAGSGEFIVPIQAKLSVDKPVAFAITLEKPGGVVVSAGPLLVVAPVGS